MSTERDEILDDAAAAPNMVVLDGTTVMGKPMSSLIEWDKYQSEKEAAKSQKAGLKMFKIVGDGAV